MEAVDLLIGMSISAAENNIQRRIGVTRYAICGSPDYFSQNGMPKKPSELNQHRYITHSMRQPDDMIVFKNREMVTLTPYLRVNDAATMARLATEGVGIVMLHQYVVHNAIKEGKLQEVLQEYVEPEIPIYVAFPQRRYTPTKVRCFVDFIIDKLKRGPPLFVGY